MCDLQNRTRSTGFFSWYDGSMSIDGKDNCLDVKAISLRIFLLGTRYSPKSIQQAPMSDPNPSRNPMKNQTLAPWFPKQPVV